ncbi:SemiSWEET family transporter [Methanobacterium sp. ACI-7]|uniref:SemiSWEET family transporter n=1 Tax=unclassified Methanobacterium TaxID=2627676 RepID=UPI0039C093CC
MSIETIGLIASIFAILMFISPIDQIRDIMRDKTSHTVSPIMYLMMILNCFFWVIYGLGINDFYIITPNAIGIFLGMATVIVIFRYRK